MLVETPVGPVAAPKQVAVNLNTCILVEDGNEAVYNKHKKGLQVLPLPELSCL